MSGVAESRSKGVRSEPDLSANAREVMERRYLARDSRGKVIETPTELWRRVARAVASAEKAFVSEADAEAMVQRFEELLRSRVFLPNSPTLMNAGRPLGQLSACFVLPVEDSLAGIFDTLKHAALIHQSGGGTGFAFSRLRSRGSVVRSSSGVASGPVSFLKVFNGATEAIKQGGTRRGANMGILRVDHPDILEFVDIKNDPREVTNFNLSVGVTGEFMAAVEADQEIALRDARDGAVSGRLQARELFERMVTNAWRTGDPGLVFLDRINADNPTPDQGPIEATNPCGEQPLLPYEACNLGSLNLAGFVESGEVDWARLKDVTRLAVRFLDDVIEVNRYPLPEIDRVVKRNRKIGLGVMGFADLLIELGIPYDSEAGLEMGERIMRHVQAEAEAASIDLAVKRGPFPAFATSTLRNRPPRRNATVTTVAPTGTLAMIADCSSGIEPLFAVSFVKRVLDGRQLVYVHPAFVRMAKELGFWSEAMLATVARTGGVQEIADVPEPVRRLFRTAHDITPEWHVKMQAAFQAQTENAVSKTINFPRSATIADVREAYLLAYRLGLKGITVYRDGSRESQVLERGQRVAATISATFSDGEGSAAAVAAAPPVHQEEIPLRPLRPGLDGCPECGSRLVHQEGCWSCTSCGLAMC
jgi:ribonucleoside-diphosphate reductase alpha chain